MREHCSCEAFIKTLFYSRVKTWRETHPCKIREDLIISDTTSDTTIAIGFTMESPTLPYEEYEE